MWGGSWDSRQGEGEGAGGDASGEAAGEREPLALSKHSSGGATDDAAKTGNGAGAGGARGREPKPRSSSSGFFRGMMMAMPSKGKKQKQKQLAAEMARSPKSPQVSRGRAVTSAASAKPSAEAGVRRSSGLSPNWAMQRRSSAAGYEGLPEMPPKASARRGAGGGGIDRRKARGQQAAVSPALSRSFLVAPFRRGCERWLQVVVWFGMLAGDRVGRRLVCYC